MIHHSWGEGWVCEPVLRMWLPTSGYQTQPGPLQGPGNWGQSWEAPGTRPGHRDRKLTGRRTECHHPGRSGSSQCPPLPTPAMRGGLIRCTEAQQPAGSEPQLRFQNHPGETGHKDKGPGSLTLPWCPIVLMASQWLQISCSDSHGADDPQGLGSHLAIIRRGHVPLAHAVAIIGIGVVCISNPLLGRKCL